MYPDEALPYVLLMCLLAAVIAWLGRGPGSLTLASLRATLEHLALCARRGLPLGASLRALADEQARAGRRGAMEADVLRRVAARADADGRLVDALAAAPELGLDAAALGLLRAAEAHGALPEALGVLAEEVEARAAMRAGIRSGLAFPLVSAVLVLGVGLFLGIFILPKFQEIHRSLTAPDGPLVSEAGHPFDAANFAITGATLGLSGAALAAALLTVAARVRPVQALRRGAMALARAAPLVGEPLRRLAHARWMRRLAGLVRAGSTLHEGLLDLATAEEATPSGMPLGRAAQAAREGQPLGEVLARALDRDARDLAPRAVLEIDRRGLAEGLDALAAGLTDRAGRRLTTVGRALQPLPVLLLGAFVATQHGAVFIFVTGMVAQTSKEVW